MFYKTLDSGKYRYYEKYYDETERKWKQVSVTLSSKTRAAQAEAKRLLADKIDKKTSNLFGFSEDITVNDVKNEWLGIRRLEIKESTYHSQLGILKKFFVQFGSTKLKQISHSMLQKYLMSNETWSASYRILNKTLIALFFEYCYKVGYISENPAKMIVLPKQKKNLEEVRRKQEKYLSKEEMKQYLEFLDWYHAGEINSKRLLVEFLYLTGLRSGEAFALRWEDVDFENQMITICRNLYLKKRSIYDFEETSPKTVNSYRVIEVNARTLEIISLYREKESYDQEYVFFRQNGLPQSLVSFNNYLKRTFSLSGIEKDSTFKLTSHVLRHSHISLLAEMNIPVKMIMDRVGHGDEKTTLSVYTHVTQTMRQGLLLELENIEL